MDCFSCFGLFFNEAFRLLFLLVSDWTLKNVLLPWWNCKTSHFLNKLNEIQFLSMKSFLMPSLWKFRPKPYPHLALFIWAMGCGFYCYLDLDFINSVVEFSYAAGWFWNLRFLMNVNIYVWVMDYFSRES